MSVSTFANTNSNGIALNLKLSSNNGFVETFFHDSIAKSGYVLHGSLKFTLDSLVTEWIKVQSDSLRLEKSNINELEVLLKEIEAEVVLLEKQKSRNTIVFGLLLIVLILGSFFWKWMLHLNNKGLKIENTTVLKPSPITTKNSVNISDDTVEVLTHLLGKFEKERGFLDANMTLNLLSQKMHTNSTYLSKVVNNTKGINFSAYLNELRIAYIIEQLKINPRLAHYTSKALAEEAGYKTRESFTKAFFKKMGESPIDYVSKMESAEI